MDETNADQEGTIDPFEQKSEVSADVPGRIFTDEQTIASKKNLPVRLTTKTEGTTTHVRDAEKLNLLQQQLKQAMKEGEKMAGVEPTTEEKPEIPIKLDHKTSVMALQQAARGTRTQA